MQRATAQPKGRVTLPAARAQDARVRVAGAGRSAYERRPSRSIGEVRRAARIEAATAPRSRGRTPTSHPSAPDQRHPTRDVNLEPLRRRQDVPVEHVVLRTEEVDDEVPREVVEERRLAGREAAVDAARRADETQRRPGPAEHVAVAALPRPEIGRPEAEGDPVDGGGEEEGELAEGHGKAVALDVGLHRLEDG